jgi:hypothetical protein
MLLVLLVRDLDWEMLRGWAILTASVLLREYVGTITRLYCSIFKRGRR